MPPPTRVANAACPDGGLKATAELVFGRVAEDGSGGVSEAEFARFLAGEVSPRFPEGLTVIDAEGRWEPPAGAMIREPAKLVMIVLPGAKDDRRKLEAVRLAYLKRFRQPSALLMTHGDCVSF
ncbi:MAG TPA: DUF3574 domain-containing protein [Caulobacteraceae bacterium]|nr:DUF3574 domain-containing protein [Caulobacteraceae bacterium]